MARETPTIPGIKTVLSRKLMPGSGMSMYCRAIIPLTTFIHQSLHSPAAIPLRHSSRSDLSHGWPSSEAKPVPFARSHLSMVRFVIQIAHSILYTSAKNLSCAHPCIGPIFKFSLLQNPSRRVISVKSNLRL